MSAGPIFGSTQTPGLAVVESPLAGFHVAADALIAIASLTVAATLLYLVLSRPTLLYRRAFFLVGALLAALGLTHAFGIVGGSDAMLLIAAGLKLVTGLLALGAAIAMWRVLPAALALPSRAELQRLTLTLEERVATRTADLTTANEQLREAIAQREEAEAEVRRLNTELQTHLAEVQGLFKLLPVGVAIATDTSGRDIRSNQALADLLGLPALSSHAPSASPFFAPDFRLMREGHELLPDENPMRRALAENAAVRDFEATVVRRDRVAIDVIINAVPVRDAAGQVRGCVATFQDITAHKEAQRRRLDFERKLLQSQKLESIGVLAGGIAHDFNNLLTGVLGHANFARSELARGGTNIDPMLAQVEQSAERAADLCRQLLAYAGKGRLVVRLIDLNVAVEQAVPLLRLSTAKKVSLDLKLGAALPPFRGDPSQISQVLVNLVTNASEAIGNNPGTITVRSERVQLAPLDLITINGSADMEAGTFVCLEVRDTGCGITPEALAHIFEPFFTTKFVGRGLGLAAVLGIVHGHRGGIRVSSTPGAGAVFELFFPVAAAPASPINPGVSAGRTPARRMVLVVDDDETVRSFAATALTNGGYGVVCATDGEHALSKLRGDPTQFDAVLLDLTMPKLDGEDTLMALRMLAPNLPVVLTSGYSDQTVAQRFVGRGIAEFLPKPFKQDTLLNTIAAAIGRPRAQAGVGAPVESGR